MGMKTANTTIYSTKRLALLAILTALVYIGRLVFQFLPNVQPMTAILIILTLHMGISDGLIVATLSLVLTNMIMGMGPWTFAQLFSFAMIIFFTGFVMKPMYRKNTKWLFVIFAFVTGFIYGFVISIVEYNVYGMTNFWVYYVAGLPFDFAHAVGNPGFYLLLEPILRPILGKYIAT